MVFTVLKLGLEVPSSPEIQPTGKSPDTPARQPVCLSVQFHSVFLCCRLLHAAQGTDTQHVSQRRVGHSFQLFFSVAKSCSYYHILDRILKIADWHLTQPPFSYCAFKTGPGPPLCGLSHSAESDSVASWTVALQTPLSTGILQARILQWAVMVGLALFPFY